MIFMFVTGIILALAFGTAFGILYAQSQRSRFTKKFKAQLEEITKEYDERLRDLQRKDAEALRKVQESFQKTVSENILSSVPKPPPSEYN